MAKLFISYRRKDDKHAVGRLKGLLEKYVKDPQNDIFVDVTSIKPGEKFVDYIKQRVDEAEIVLVVIGPRWLEELNNKKEDPNDYLRIEVAAALNRKVRVVPILLDNTSFPDQTQLPEELSELTNFHFHRLSHTSFETDVAALAEGLSLSSHSFSLSDFAKNVSQVSKSTLDSLLAAPSIGAPDLKVTAPKIDAKPPRLNTQRAEQTLPDAKKSIDKDYYTRTSEKRSSQNKNISPWTSTGAKNDSPKASALKGTSFLSDREAGDEKVKTSTNPKAEFINEQGLWKEPLKISPTGAEKSSQPQTASTELPFQNIHDLFESNMAPDGFELDEEIKKADATKPEINIKSDASLDKTAVEAPPPVEPNEQPKFESNMVPDGFELDEKIKKADATKPEINIKSDASLDKTTVEAPPPVEPNEQPKFESNMVPEGFELDEKIKKADATKPEINIKSDASLDKTAVEAPPPVEPNEQPKFESNMVPDGFELDEEIKKADATKPEINIKSDASLDKTAVEAPPPVEPNEQPKAEAESLPPKASEVDVRNNSRMLEVDTHQQDKDANLDKNLRIQIPSRPHREPPSTDNHSVKGVYSQSSIDIQSSETAKIRSKPESLKKTGNRKALTVALLLITLCASAYYVFAVSDSGPSSERLTKLQTVLFGQNVDSSSTKKSTKRVLAERAQTALINMQYLEGPMDGIVGPKTEHAMKIFSVAEEVDLINFQSATLEQIEHFVTLAEEHARLGRISSSDALVLEGPWDTVTESQWSRLGWDKLVESVISRSSFIDLLAAADGGNVNAQALTALAYRGNAGVDVNFPLAMKYARSACFFGHANACANRGNLYYNGYGVAEDFARASIFSDLACTRGNSFACNHMAAIHELGLVSEANSEKAKSYYEQACSLGFFAACE